MTALEKVQQLSKTNSRWLEVIETGVSEGYKKFIFEKIKENEDRIKVLKIKSPEDFF